MDEQSQGPEQPVSQSAEELYVEREAVEEEIWSEPPAWPKVIGIISAVWGGLGLGCLGCGVFGVLSPTLFQSGMQQAFPDGMPPVLTQPPLVMYASFGVSAVVTLFLLLAGIVLILRKPIARPMHLVYALIGMLSAALGLYVQYVYQSEITQWVKQNPDTAYAQRQGGAGIGQTIGIVVGIVFGFAWPVFCLLWFTVVKPRSEAIAEGAELTA